MALHETCRLTGIAAAGRSPTGTVSSPRGPETSQRPNHLSEKKLFRVELPESSEAELSVKCSADPLRLNPEAGRELVSSCVSAMGRRAKQRSREAMRGTQIFAKRCPLTRTSSSPETSPTSRAREPITVEAAEAGAGPELEVEGARFVQRERGNGDRGTGGRRGVSGLPKNARGLVLRKGRYEPVRIRQSGERPRFLRRDPRVSRRISQSSQKTAAHHGPDQSGRWWKRSWRPSPSGEPIMKAATMIVYMA